MNKPEHILTDVIGEVVEAARVQLNLDYPGAWPILNYQFGEIEELNETLAQWMATKGATPPNDVSELRFPLVWLMEPYKIADRGKNDLYGRTEGLNIVIINETQPEWKAKQRMDNNYKTIILPIYRELINQMVLHSAITGSGEGNTPLHDFMNKYYFGYEEKTTLNDVVDVSIIMDIEIEIYNNQNCN